MLTEAERKEISSIVLPHLNRIYRFSLYLCRDRDKAEELAAESVAKACEKFKTLKDRSKVRQWLFRIVNNTFVSQYRREKFIKGFELTELSLNGKMTSPVPFRQGGISSAHPEKILINKLLDDDIKFHLRKLPEEFRSAVVLCDVEGMSYIEIAKVLEIPIGTVRSRVARGRGLLQKKLMRHAREMGFVKAVKKREKEKVCDCK